MSRYIEVSRFVTLAAIRDALLPKLLSGEIRMSNAKGEVDRHA
jgi:hypothetical protein